MTDSSTDADAFLEVKDLCKTYRKGQALIQVLNGATFAIGRGDMVSVVGKSGAGKSTLLHLLGTLDIPDAGKILFEGHNLVGQSNADLADFRNRKLGFVFQFHHLLPEFSAVENVAMPAMIRRIARTEAKDRAERALKLVGLHNRLEHKPGELSGGEQQRVALARALVLEPPLLLADEVTGNLDERTGEEIHELLFSINRDHGVTLIVVTHNRSLADRMPRRLVLEDAQIKERA